MRNSERRMGRILVTTAGYLALILGIAVGCDTVNQAFDAPEPPVDLEAEGPVGEDFRGHWQHTRQGEDIRALDGLITIEGTLDATITAVGIGAVEGKIAVFVPYSEEVLDPGAPLSAKKAFCDSVNEYVAQMVKADVPALKNYPVVFREKSDRRGVEFTLAAGAENIRTHDVLTDLTEGGESLRITASMDFPKLGLSFKETDFLLEKTAEGLLAAFTAGDSGKVTTLKFR